MSSSHPPPATGTYKRPSLPPPRELADRTSSLKESNDRLAKSLGVTLRRPVAPARLAETIRQANDQREARSVIGEEQENARLELLTACDAIRTNYPIDPMIGLFQDAVREFLTALGAKAAPTRADALRAMREAVKQMDQARGLGERS